MKHYDPAVESVKLLEEINREAMAAASERKEEELPICYPPAHYFPKGSVVCQCGEGKRHNFSETFAPECRKCGAPLPEESVNPETKQGLCGNCAA